jgi:hypothetical protein
VTGIEFDWDAGNIRHLKRHRVTPDEFEEIMKGDPAHLEYQARMMRSDTKCLA